MMQERNGEFSGFDFVAQMNRTSKATIVFLVLCMTAAMPASAVEHPGVLPKDANCSSCHAAKINGKSVHSAMLTSCTVCHLVATQGDMTMVSLAMPKSQICFACHEKAVELRLHKAAAKGLCVDCHDAHSSDRRMLLRVLAEVRPCSNNGAEPTGSDCRDPK